MPPEPTTPRQQSIPGTEPDHPEVAYRIERWLEAKAAREHALELEQAADDAVLMTMTEHGVPHYPYTDPKSGKRKYRYVDTSPRIKSVSARPDGQPEQADEPTLNDGETATEAVADNTVTHRRVPRASAEAELAAIADETRARDDADNPMAQGAAAVDGALRPARNWDDENDDGQPEQADEPMPEPTRYDLLEPYDKPSAAVHEVPVGVTDGKEKPAKPEKFDAALLAAGKCALRYEGGAGCELDVDHAGLHASAVHKWKARRPKPDVVMPGLLEQAEQAQDAAREAGAVAE